MRTLETMRCQALPLEFEYVRYPKGWLSQGDVADWIKSKGGTANLHDGAMRKLEEPAEDGSFASWSYISVSGPDDHSVHAYVGDYIMHHGAGDFRVVKPWDFTRLYEQVADDV